MSTYSFDYTPYLEQLVPMLKEFEKTRLSRSGLSKSDYIKISKKHTKPDGSLFSKNDVIQAYRQLAGAHGLAPFSQELVQKLQMKPTRTISGVAPITVLTKPFPCPGKCIFCPNDVRMPKSYLSDEPGAQRAERNYFDPYLQTYNRLQALHNIGHQVSKAEIIVLGGTWSFYSQEYQIWFIKECFRALNDFGEDVVAGVVGDMPRESDSAKRDDRERIIAKYEEMNKVYRQANQHSSTDNPVDNKRTLAEHEIDGAFLDESYNQVVSQLYVAPERKAGFDKFQSASWEELEAEQKTNESAVVRCVGLVVETRPDNISVAEVRRIRRLGCTKTQIGVQSLQDEVLEKNKRGHGVAATRNAFKLLRQAGFKIHAHWMANLHGSSVELDKKDYDLLFSDPDFKPDELKIYPCSLINSAELMQYYKDGRWKPYTHDELLEVVSHAIAATPPYCRLTRIIRDIPSTDIVTGNKLTNFRQIAQDSLRKGGGVMQDIRAREIRGDEIKPEKLEFSFHEYETSVSKEYFLQYTCEEKLVGFLRLSLPTGEAYEKPIFDELTQAAMIREIHVYGPTVKVGGSDFGKPQHLGIGTALIEQAKKITLHVNDVSKQDLKKRDDSTPTYSKLAVISSIGTKEYYRSRGFYDGELYQFMEVLADKKD